MTTQDALYDEILKHGASSETYRVLLSELKKQGHPGKVLQACLKAVRIYPQDIFLRRLLAESYLEAGFITQAEAELEKLTSQIEELVSTYKLQADIYRQQKRRDEAIRSLRVYLAHRPEDHEAHNAFEALHASAPVKEPGPPAEVEEKLAGDVAQVSAREEPEAPEETMEIKEDKLPEIATPTLAEVYVNQGEIEEALNIYQKVIDQTPQDEKSRLRIEELTRMLVQDFPAPEKKPDRARRKKERAIAILEAWLAGLRKMHQDSLTT
jgi:tetratricopeptide (TPR) repeat protein